MVEPMHSHFHFHICWENKQIDWEAFNTREEAVDAARNLLRDSETFTIVEEFDGSCERCAEVRNLRRSRSVSQS